MKSLWGMAAFAVALFSAPVLAAEVPAYVTAAIDSPDRPAADRARDAERKPAEMVTFAGVMPGDKVLELIPGGGYFTKIFSNAVGSSGHVYAFEPVELDAFYAQHGTAQPQTGGNVTVVHKPINDISAPEKVDVVWTSQNYHDLHDKAFGPANIAAVNKAVFDALRPGGVFIVLDHAAPPGSGLQDTQTLHRIDEASVKSEVEAAGFVLEGESNVLRNPKDPHTIPIFDKSIRGHTDQFILKFRKPAQ